VKYKPVSEKCVKGCGRKRRAGQRTCKKCHAEEMRALRVKESGADAKTSVQRALVRVARKGVRGALTPEMQANLERLAADVVRRMDEFNRSAEKLG
jgi:hypothetical protein